MKARNQSILKCAIKAIGTPLVVALTMSAAGIVDAATVTYTMQTGNFNSLLTQNNNNAPYAGTYNSGSTQLAQYANGGWFGTTPGAAAFQTFTTTGNGNTGSVRALQVGDTFTITNFISANPSAGGSVGISFRDSTTYTNFSSSTDSATEARFQLDNTGGWKVYNSGSAIDSSQGSNTDRTFTIKITSSTTFDATIGGTTYYNLGMAASGGTIDSFAVYTLGDSNQDSVWKSASLSDTGTVELGYAAANGTTLTPGLVSDGLAANSTSTTRSNAVNIGGDAGSQVNLTQNNTYTGATTINANATAEAQHANALGTTGAGTTVTNAGTLKLWGGVSYASEALTLNGLGRAYGDVAGDAGALRSNGGNNTWNGNITLASNSRINADTAGGAGSLTIAGNVDGGTNVLYLGTKVGASANISISGTISGAGATQDGTTTSLFKDGANTLTLSGNNTYTGDTRVNNGTLTVASGGNLGNGTSDVFISSGGTLNINSNTTVASVQETGNSNGGVIAIGSGATLTVNGASKGALFQNSISGSGGLTVNGSGNTSLNLYGTQSYSGATTVSGAKLSTAVALATSGVTINGGTFETTAANILGNSASVNLSSGTYSLGGNDTIGSLTISGGSLSGTSTLTASSYALNGGTVGANLGAGTLSVGGSTTLNGTSAASSVSLTSGVLTLGGSNRLSTGASVSLGAGTTLGLGANSQQLAALTGSGAVTTTTSGNLNLNIASGSNTFGGAISGGGGLTKSGSGTLFLTGTNTLTGTTNVTSGIVRVNGSIAGAATVSSSATLGGTGTISGSVNVSGILSPGASIESLAVGTTSFSNGSTFEWEYNSQDVTADLLAINGDLNLSGTVSLDIIDLASVAQLIANDTKFTLISYTGSWNNGTFNGYADDSTFSFGGNEWVINYNDLTGGSNYSADQSGAFGFVTMTVVPEPSSLGLALLAGGFLAARRRRTA